MDLDVGHDDLLVQALLEATFEEVEHRDPADRLGPVYGPREHFLELVDDFEDEDERRVPLDPEVDRGATWQALVEPVPGSELVVVTGFEDGRVEVAEISAAWHGQVPEARRSAAHRFELPPFRELEWRTLDLRAAMRRAVVIANLVRSTHELREARASTCPYCRRNATPNRGVGATCDGCMTAYFGMVF